MGLFDRLPGLGGGRDGAEAGASGGDAAGEDGGFGDTADPGAPSPAEYRERAAALADRSDVPTLDYTVDSLDRLDDLVAGHAPVADPVIYGSYLGETLVRAYGGEWTDDDGPAVAVPVDGDETTVAVFDAARMALSDGPLFAKVARKLEAEGARAGPPADGGGDGPSPGIAADDDGARDRDATGGAASSAEGGDEPTGEPPTDDQSGEAATGEPSADQVAPDASPGCDPSVPERDADEPPAAPDVRPDDDREEGGTGPEAPETTLDAPEVADPSASGDAAEAGAGSTDGAAAGDGADPDPPDGDALAATAEAFAESWPDRDLDVTPASLVRLDDFLDAQWAGRFDGVDLGDRPVEPGPDAGALTRVGAYYGQVLVRWLAGEWVRTPSGEPAVRVAGSGDSAEVVAAFDDARECLAGDSTFAYRYDALLYRLDREETPVSDGRASLTVPAAGEGAGDLSSADVITAVADDAAAFADEWADYDLGYSPASLSRLDALVDGELRDDAFEGVPLEEPTDAASLRLTARVARAGAYFATVAVRHLGAQWRIDGDVALAVDGPGGATTLTPFETAHAAVLGEASFAEAYETVRRRCVPTAPAVREDGSG